MNHSTTNPGVGHFLLFRGAGALFVAFCTLLKLIPTYIPGWRRGGFLGFCGAISNNTIIPMLVKCFFCNWGEIVCLKYGCLDVPFFVSAIDLSDLLLISSVYPVHRGDNSLSRCPEKNTSHRKPLFSLVSVFSSKLPQILITWDLENLNLAKSVIVPQTDYCEARVIETNYSWTSRKRPPKMSSLGGHLIWEVVAYER